MHNDSTSTLQLLKQCRNQIIAASVATLGSFGTGTVFGWSSVATDSIANDFSKGKKVVTKEMITWVTSLAILGAFLGGPVAGFTMNYFGRKSSIFVFSPPFLLGWIVMCCANLFKPRGFFLLYLGRFLTGMCAGSYLVIVPTYIKEVSADEIRGILGSAVTLMLVAGILYTFVIGAFYKWFEITISCCIPPVCLILATFFIPETPRYLVNKQNMEKAASSVKWLNKIKTDNAAQEKLMQILSAEGIDTTKVKAKSHGLFSRPVLLPVVIIVFVVFFQQFGGVNAVTLYTNSIFASAGDFIRPEIALIIIGIVQVLFVLVSMFLVDVLGRKTLLIGGSFMMGMSLIGLGTFFYIKEKGDGSEKAIAWLPIVTVCTFLAGYSIGSGPVAWVLGAEMYNPDYRAESATVMSCSYWMFGFVVAKIYEDLRSGLGESGSFWFYGGICIMSSIFAAMFVPETKGKSSEEILRYFGGLPEHSNHAVGNDIGDFDIQLEIDSIPDVEVGDSCFPIPEVVSESQSNGENKTVNVDN